MSTTPSGMTHANVSSPSFLRTDASAARSSSYRRLRSTPGRSSRSPTAAWRTRASGSHQNVEPGDPSSPAQVEIAVVVTEPFVEEPTRLPDVPSDEHRALQST